MASKTELWKWNFKNLVIVIFIFELFSIISTFHRSNQYFFIINGVNGQLNLWVERQLVIQIIESMPNALNSAESLRCPRRVPEIQRHIPEHLFLVFNGLLLYEALDRISLSAHRPIPPRIDMLRVKWRAGFERLTYHIDLKSMNQTLLHTPLLNIAISGYVPATQSDVQISLPCTGRFTGIAPFQVRLDIQREFEGLRKIPPISFIVYKYCLSAAQHTKFIIKCECRARCSQSYLNFGTWTRKQCIRQCRRRFGLRQSNRN